mgnify:CR=1 FL=1
MHAQPFYEIGHFLGGEIHLAAKILGKFVTYILRVRKTHWHSHDVSCDECIGRLDKKMSQLPLPFWVAAPGAPPSTQFLAQCYRNALNMRTIWSRISTQVCMHYAHQNSAWIAALVFLVYIWDKYVTAPVDSISKNGQFATMQWANFFYTLHFNIRG